MGIEYSIRYIKQNKITSIFLAVISFLSTAFLSLTCGVFYNMWLDRVTRKTLSEGSSTGKLEPIVIAYAFILIVICFSLTAMIHNAFEVSMNSRVHQLGILKSVGATPKQIRSFLLQEVLLLCIAPIAAGVLSGAGLCYGFMQLIITVTNPVREYEIIFRYPITIIGAAFLLSMLTVLFSAWIPAQRISRLTPLNAIHYGEEPPVKKMKHFRIVSSILGVYGELARKSIYSRRRALRTSTFSLALSFLAFTSFLNLEVISGISTRHTYFERYEDKWDLMLTTSDMQEQEDFILKEMKQINGVESCIAYKKITAVTNLSQDMLNRDALTNDIKADGAGNVQFAVPIYVLDNESFRIYCTNNGLSPRENAVALNIIWDSVHSDRINRTYLPLLNTENPLQLSIRDNNLSHKENTLITVSSFTNKLPEIKEEFTQYSLTLVISQDLYQTIEDFFPTTEILYNIKTVSEDYDAAIQERIKTLLPENSGYTLDSRLEDENSDASMRNALKIVAGALAGLLSCIGIANIFSSALGQIYQRRKEFARYISIGLSPKGMKKILALETLIIVLRPIILSLVINIPVIAIALNTASISIKEFITDAPIMPIFIFTTFILLFVSLAYYLGGRKICNADIVDVLKDETML